MARACTSMSGVLSVLTSRRWAPIQADHRLWPCRSPSDPELVNAMPSMTTGAITQGAESREPSTHGRPRGTGRRKPRVWSN